MRMMYAIAAAVVLVIHAAWLAWVALGVLATRGRPVLSAVHIGSLAWGIAVEVGPWPCPLTALEQHFQQRAGMTPYRQSFLVHYLDRLVYPDIPLAVLVTAAVGVCVLNLGVYVARWLRTQGWRE
jgi:hypothetical protein